MTPATRFNNVFQDYAKKENIDLIGQKHGVYLAWKHRRWKIVKLNPFYQFLRNWFGFFSSTHLKTVGPRLKDLKTTCLTQESLRIHQKIISCWLNHYEKLNTYSRLLIEAISNEDFLRMYEVILDKGISEIAKDLDWEGLFRESGDVNKMRETQEMIFYGKLPEETPGITTSHLYAQLIKRFTKEYSNRLEQKFFSQLESNVKLIPKIDSLRRVTAQHCEVQMKKYPERKNGLSFVSLQEVCVKLNLGKIV